MWEFIVTAIIIGAICTMYISTHKQPRGATKYRYLVTITMVDGSEWIGMSNTLDEAHKQAEDTYRPHGYRDSSIAEIEEHDYLEVT